jgi:hypothetical protein
MKRETIRIIGFPSQGKPLYALPKKSKKLLSALMLVVVICYGFADSSA